jgi:uncharacterized FAD-dependent dehydrogenase
MSEFQEIEIVLLPEELNSSEAQIREIEQAVGALNGRSFKMVKRSLDARKKPIIYRCKVQVWNGEIPKDEPSQWHFSPASFSKKVHIIGFGPAGMYAALSLLENGIQPIIWERGKAVQERRRDLAAINKEKKMNPESNYCFGEGGAGTYSDGKLYTRSKKRGDVKRVIQSLIDHGADPRIAIDAHPHIGTNKLPGIIENIRQTILEFGGEIHFDTKLVDVELNGNQIVRIQNQHGNWEEIETLVLATGHSARDIFELFHRRNIFLEAKPFALGLRIEHPQNLIDQIQYKQDERGDDLPPSSYSLVTQAKGNGVFSFCMCPGGIIAPAATDHGEMVVNGWSPSKRNGKFANSGMVVTVNPEHWAHLESDYGPLAALEFQKQIEKRAFDATQSLAAPAQRMEDFIQQRVSSDLPHCSYLPGLVSADLNKILPPFIAESLREGLIDFGKKMRGYRTNEAVLVGVESRTSSPVRIPRDRETMRHLEIVNLYPCGEGPGYAGGIMSAALDGMAAVQAMLQSEFNTNA